MKRMLWLLILTSVLLLGVGPANQPTALGEDQEVTRPSVFISEICFWPLAGEPAWVELVNRGRDAVDVRGFVLSLRSGHRYVFREAIGSVPPGGFILVKFDGRQGKLPDDLSFE
ncbi:MAG: lamin tail domain-containing protein, partial [Planctomycetota bacterium]